MSLNTIKNMIAIGNCVVDCLYEPGEMAAASYKSGDTLSGAEFLSNLPAYLPTGALKAAPRAGDNILVVKEVLEDSGNAYIDAKSALSASADFNQVPVLERLFGKPFLTAGGSLANTVASLANSRRGGQPIVNATFLTVLDEGEAGTVFADSMPIGVVAGPVKGECLKVHVVPHQGDRIMVAAPSRDNSTDFYNIAPHIVDAVNASTDIVMIEGYLAYGPHFQAIADATLAAIIAANMERAETGRGPIQLVIAAAAQRICEIDMFQSFFERAIQTTHVTVHANTGEFRRLINRDTAWRVAYDEANGNPFAGLDGDELEDAKRTAPGYREAKTDANTAAIGTAINIARETPFELEFVITDGGNPGYIVSQYGYGTFLPPKMDPSKIVNKVGAGDAFMAGFWAAKLSGLTETPCMHAGNVFAQATIMQQDARLSPKLRFGNYQGPLSLLPRHGVIKAIKTPSLEA